MGLEKDCRRVNTLIALWKTLEKNIDLISVIWNAYVRQKYLRARSSAMQCYYLQIKCLQIQKRILKQYRRKSFTKCGQFFSIVSLFSFLVFACFPPRVSALHWFQFHLFSLKRLFCCVTRIPIVKCASMSTSSLSIPDSNNTYLSTVFSAFAMLRKSFPSTKYSSRNSMFFCLNSDSSSSSSVCLSCWEQTTHKTKTNCHRVNALLKLRFVNGI